jgi:nucleotide-binding universal stress UspA family protein
MFEELAVCLDGSSLAERIIPLAESLTDSAHGKLSLLRVFSDRAKMPVEQEHLQECARSWGAELRMSVSPDPARAILSELRRGPHITPALATHGRSGWSEVVMGSVARQVLREAARPVLLFGPHDGDWQRRRRIKTVAAALDGSPLSESILPYAVKAALALSARLLLLQVLPENLGKAELSHEQPSDLLESGYVQRQAAALKKAYLLEPEWEVLHGAPGKAICRHLKDLPETLLAMTTHGRPLTERLIVGSVAGYCVRHGRVPLLLQWPDRQIK